MVSFWLQFHPLFILPGLLLLFTFSGGLIHWLQSRSPWRDSFAKYALAPQAFATTSVLFALFAGFLLANIMTHKDRALRAVQLEVAALRSLDLHAAAMPAHGAAVHGAVRDYARSVLADEWPRMLKAGGSPVTEQALSALLRMVNEAPAGSVPSAVHSQMLSLAQQVADARGDRVTIVSNNVRQLAWTALFLLGFLTQFASGMSHLERPQANICSIAVFGFAAVIALWLIAIQDNPFRGPSRVLPAPLEDLLAVFAK